LPPHQPDELPELLAAIRAGRHVEHFETVRLRADGTRLHISLTLSPIHDATGEVVGASSIARDITDRRAADEMRAELDNSAARQAQAFQINDSIVQYLVVAQARLEVGDVPGAAAAIGEGLVRARGLIDDLMPETAAVPLSAEADHHVVLPQGRDVSTSPCSVVIADDSDEIRLLMRMLLEMEGGFDVVAEAGNGRDAISAAQDHHPDLVLLDHSMPIVDGLTALSTIREVSPDSVVVMLSGFSADRMADAALANGATAYLSKANLASEVIPELQRIMGIEATVE